MNFSSIFGIIIATLVIVGGVFTSAKNPLVFLDYHAALIVLGGTAAATLLSFSAKNIFALIVVVFRRVLKSTSGRYSDVIGEIVDLATGYRKNSKYLSEKVSSLKTPFLKEAVELTIEGGLSAQEIDMILQKRSQTVFKRYGQDSQMFGTLAKFPPAFGLFGAVIGMISLMQGLGGADAIKTVGPAMAVALVATLYGIGVANFVFIPLGENLARSNQTDKVIRQMIMDGIVMIRAKKHPLLVEENIKSYLLPSERALLKPLGTPS